MMLRAGTFAWMLYRMYRRLPPGQRRRLRGVAARQGFTMARRYAPGVAGAMWRARTRRR